MAKRTFIVLLILSIAAMAGSASAQAQQPSERIETRTYDISDLLRATADYPMSGAPQSIFLGRGGRGTPPPPPQPLPSEDLMMLIQDTIARESWRDNGGQIGSLRALGSMLVITQTTENHDLIRKLFEQLRSDPGPATMLCVRAFWVKLDATEVAAIFAARKPKPGGNVYDMPEVPERLLDKDHLYYMGQTICFNGQTVHVKGGRQTSYITDVTPVVATGAVGYDPTIGLAETGVELQVTPQIMPNGELASIDLHSIVRESYPSNPVPLAVSTTQPVVVPAGVVGIDRINSVTQEFHTTVRVPVRKKVLVGGMTLEPASKDAPPRQLFMVIEVDAVR